MQYPSHLLKLMQVLKKFPGVGNKSAERFAFHLLSWPAEHLKEFGDVVLTTKERLKQCGECGCLIDKPKCDLCDISKRKTHIICVIASAREVFSIEATREYNGLYHVLGGVLSPLDNRGPEHLTTNKLKERIVSLGIEEVIIALDSTLEGDATSLFLKNELAPLSLQVSRLAFGLPIGSALEYVDGGTLARAFVGRNQF